MTTLLKFADGVGLLTLWAGRLATALVLFLIALVFYNAVGRYIVGGSPIWQQELEWHLMVPAMLIGIAVLIRDRGHVRVDILYNKLPEKTRHLLDALSMLVSAGIALLFIKYSQGFLESSWSVLEGSPDPGGIPGRYLLKSLLPVCFGLLALQCLANAILHLSDFLNAKHAFPHDGGQGRG